MVELMELVSGVRFHEDDTQDLNARIKLKLKTSYVSGYGPVKWCYLH